MGLEDVDPSPGVTARNGFITGGGMGHMRGGHMPGVPCDRDHGEGACDSGACQRGTLDGPAKDVSRVKELTIFKSRLCKHPMIAAGQVQQCRAERKDEDKRRPVQSQ